MIMPTMKVMRVMMMLMVKPPTLMTLSNTTLFSLLLINLQNPNMVKSSCMLILITIKMMLKIIIMCNKNEDKNEDKNKRSDCSVRLM